MEHFLTHWSSTLSPGDLAITLRNLIEGTALLIIFALPAAFVLYSRKVSGRARIAWFVMTLCLSWPAYAVFVLITRSRHCMKADAANSPTSMKAPRKLSAH